MTIAYVRACVHFFTITLAAVITCFSSTPLWFFLPVPTAHAHANVLYHHMAPVGLLYRFATHSVRTLHRLFFLTLILFLFGLVGSFVELSISSITLCSFFFLLSQHFTIHEHHAFWFYFTHRLFFLSESS